MRPTNLARIRVAGLKVESLGQSLSQPDASSKVEN